MTKCFNIKQQLKCKAESTTDFPITIISHTYANPLQNGILRPTRLRSCTFNTCYAVGPIVQNV